MLGRYGGIALLLKPLRPCLDVVLAKLVQLRFLIAVQSRPLGLGLEETHGIDILGKISIIR